MRRIFFDFELMGDSAIDAHLMDILFAIREKLRKQIIPYEKKIEEQGGIIIIRLIPGEAGIGFWGLSDEFAKELDEKVGSCLDFATAIKKLGFKDLN